jgi:hypothetical protein
MSDWIYWFIAVQLIMDVFIVIRLDFHGSWLKKINEVLELMNK